MRVRWRGASGAQRVQAVLGMVVVLSVAALLLGALAAREAKRCLEMADAAGAALEQVSLTARGCEVVTQFGTRHVELVPGGVTTLLLVLGASVVAAWTVGALLTRPGGEEGS